MSTNGCGGKSNSCASKAPLMAKPISTYDDCRNAADAAPVQEPQAQGPYIALNPNLPGIVAGFMYDMANAKNLSAMGQTIMRRSRDLTPGERELIFAYVSKLNECEFCSKSHIACATEFLGRDLVQEVVVEKNFGRLDNRMIALLKVAAATQSLNRKALPAVTAAARAAGASDQEIHDAVLVASFASMCNRYVDGLGTTFKPGEEVEGGKGLAKYGYTFGIRRFFGEMLPQLWRKLVG